ncbi:MAG: NUDIX domain-containing protein [Anaerolineales bacterium]|nr:NUDIX domain-containing protein [Anaerolineales bacterium]
MEYCPQCGNNDLVHAEVDGRERLKCTSASCDFVHWDNPTPVVAAIVELYDHVILVRNKGWPEKIFGLIAGFLEKDETPEESILREVREELGLEGEIVDFIGNYSFFERNQIILAFHVHAQGEIQLGEELEEVKPVSPEKLRPWPFGTGPAVKDWLETQQLNHSEE